MCCCQALYFFVELLETKICTCTDGLDILVTWGTEWLCFAFTKGIQKCVCVSVGIQVALYTGLLEHIDVYSLCKSKDTNQRQNQLGDAANFIQNCST